MSVYVDDYYAPYRGMRMCHMIADTHEELMAMALTICLWSGWIQNRGTYREHFDISTAKRKLAIRAGAIPISVKELGRKLLERRNV